MTRACDECNVNFSNTNNKMVYEYHTTYFYFCELAWYILAQF